MKTTVLCVDDEKGINDLVKELLAMEGYSALTASDGVEALGVVSREKPDIVVTDIDMPNMDGLTLIAELRKINPHYAIVATSGKMEQHKGKLNELRVIEILPKPFKFDALILAVRRAHANSKFHE